MTISLHTWTLADSPTLMALCNAVDRTFLSDQLPNPYTEADADWWLRMVTENEGKEGVWRSIWADGQGIGTEAVRQMCGIAFKELGIDCIEASVFEGNRASERVLEKNGFRLEETKTGAVVKGGKAMDVRVYMLV